jgi:Mn2+/Fe2+ NRAMP family transporter
VNFVARPRDGRVAVGDLIPTVRPDAAYLTLLVALLGTTISPYLFFWQADQEVEEAAARGRATRTAWKPATAGELKDAAWDVGVGMFLSNALMFFIILATSATLHRAGNTDVGTAAEALRPLAGEGAYVLLALGLIGSGVLAVPS